MSNKEWQTVASPIDKSNSSQFKALLKRHKISDDEYAKIEAIMGRTPCLAELGVFSAMWSEHCSYKSSRVHLKRFPTTGKDVVVGPGENAGVVRLHNELCLAFKMESHNHPSYIEPYHGAATGVGGILRDVFCMGARPIANLNCLRFGQRKHPKTPYLVRRVVRGIGDYGNCIGVATVGGSISYDQTYDGNCLVNAMTVGLIRDDKIFKGFASGVGNLVVYLGSATGRDGVNGASMASDSFSSQESGERSTIQVGDPYAEKLLLEATLEVLEKKLVVGIQDMGAAGLTSSSFEMAGRAGNGVYFDLDKVPLRAKNMTAYEIMLSESQERMLMVIEPKNWPQVSEVLSKWNLAHAIIGKVTNTGLVEVCYKGTLEVNLPVAPLTDDAPVYKRPIAPKEIVPTEIRQLGELEKNLANAEFAMATFMKCIRETGSPEKIYRQYDHHIGASTVLGPDAGGAAVLSIKTLETKDNPWLGIAIAAGCNERRVKNNPHIGAADAVLQCAKDIVAAGGEPLAITDCLNFGSAEDPMVMREFSEAVDGISDACLALNTPVVSGNVSLYNSTDGKSIHPTPMIGMVGRVKDIRYATSAFAKSDSPLWLLTPKLHSRTLAASLAAKVHGIACEDGAIPAIDFEVEKTGFEIISDWRGKELLLAVRPVSQGGVVVAIAKMLLGSKSMTQNSSYKWLLNDLTDLFHEISASYVLQFSTDDARVLSLEIPPPFRLAKILDNSKNQDSNSSAIRASFIDLPFGKVKLDELSNVWNSAHYCEQEEALT